MLGEELQGLLTFCFWILEGGPERSLLIQRTAARRAGVPSPVVSSVDSEKATSEDHFPPVVGESERAFLVFHSIEMASRGRDSSCPNQNRSHPILKAQSLEVGGQSRVLEKGDFLSGSPLSFSRLSH